jgi:hypothetical protein
MYHFCPFCWQFGRVSFILYEPDVLFFPICRIFLWTALSRGVHRSRRQNLGTEDDVYGIDKATTNTVSVINTPSTLYSFKREDIGHATIRFVVLVGWDLHWKVYPLQLQTKHERYMVYHDALTITKFSCWRRGLQVALQDVCCVEVGYSEGCRESYYLMKSTLPILLFESSSNSRLFVQLTSLLVQILCVQWPNRVLKGAPWNCPLGHYRAEYIW